MGNWSNFYMASFFVVHNHVKKLEGGRERTDIPKKPSTTKKSNIITKFRSRYRDLETRVSVVVQKNHEKHLLNSLIVGVCMCNSSSYIIPEF